MTPREWVERVVQECEGDEHLLAELLAVAEALARRDEFALLRALLKRVLRN
jgi:hypothetical protein